MGLFQQALKTYNSIEGEYKGKYEEGLEPLAPVGHIIRKAFYKINLDKDGNFINAEQYDKRIIIPVTLDSAERTSKRTAHPLCETIKYLSGEDKKAYDLYINGLESWCKSKYGDKLLDAVLTYVKKGTVFKDLVKDTIPRDKKTGELKYKDSDLICWKVGETLLHESVDLMNKYENYFKESNSGLPKNVCFVSGEISEIINSHAKVFDNAKLVSSNDSENFSYRGRFNTPDEALTIGVESSQKIHNTLNWLLANKKIRIGDRRFICWSPDTQEIPIITNPFIGVSNIKKFSAYKEELSKVLINRGSNIKSDDVVLAAFDSPSKGRASIVYYNEFKMTDYLERLRYWDETCCWCDRKGNIYSPGLYRILECLCEFGVAGSGSSETKQLLKNRYMHDLIISRIEKSKIPMCIVNELFKKCNNLCIIEKEEEKKKAKDHSEKGTYSKSKLLFTVCAVIRKYYYDYFKEEFAMELEEEKKDRSYQYGRLLAILEKAEKDTYGNDMNRITNAIRMQSAFSKNPASVAKILIEQVKGSYYPKLKPPARTFYDKQIGQIFEMISSVDSDMSNKALNESYILGYYLQNNELYKKHVEEENANE